MEETHKCPQCHSNLSKGKGILEQSGQTEIPTTTWTCGCGYKEWEKSSADWETKTLTDPFTGKVVSGNRIKYS